MNTGRKIAITFAAVAAMGMAATTAMAEKMYGPGVTDTSIKIGNTMPYSGPAAAYSQIGKSINAYFNKINKENGGVNGRKIEFISLDDGYSPPKTKEQTRKLVEQDEVLLVFQGLGTPTQSAVHAYMNQKKVPQLFVATGATKWGDPENYPWTMGWQPSYQTEGQLFGTYVLKNVKDPKIAILYQNDDYGKDYVKGMKDVLGDKASELIVAEESYEVTDPTINSQIIKLKDSGANVFFNVATPKFAAQAIKKIYELNWKPVHLNNSVSNSVGAVYKPAGLEESKGIISLQYFQDVTDPSIYDTEPYKKWKKFMEEYYPDGDQSSSFTAYGYLVAQTMEQVLKQAGDNLTRENVMKEAANLDLELDMMLPGVKIQTGPDDYFPIEAMMPIAFDGEKFVPVGEVVSVN
ncbi:MAG: branched-chain amino acid ABC transporter substrate-binding protein [Sneathiella sp.]|jgi:branched-chain amino acid transport system substrate-binding protein|uniref:ABC transporter substrate-binding protein n=1 Tax=Sneathiella sp. TaxID=1964365 RepID=UPI000C3F348F|nr:ABC transporter substrate-binding protein [Sneathiella sp.]MAL80571.1 branched-chain amino acid ABC transporter substrate-binding protein [Sneathiella sp.]|tara:strand:- start:4812 stop:6029 length:1218 start_codon:yes stop_codon:yes gene_type:complete